MQVLSLVPTAPTNMLPLLVSQLPHKLRGRDVQCAYLSALLALAESRAGAPIKDALLTAVVEHLLSIDVEIKWEDIVDVPTGVCVGGGMHACTHALKAFGLMHTRRARTANNGGNAAAGMHTAHLLQHAVAAAATKLLKRPGTKRLPMRVQSALGPFLKGKASQLTSASASAGPAARACQPLMRMPG